MEYERFWSIGTLILYLTIALIVGLLFRKAIDFKNRQTIFKARNIRIKAYKLLYIIIFLILFIFLCFRLVSGEIGGTDTKIYIDMFNDVNLNQIDFENALTLNGEEPIFILLLYIVRLFSTNYHALFFVIYAIIIGAYIFFIDKNVKKKESWFIIMLAIIPILQSMNIIRQSLAIAISLVAIVKLKENKKISSLILLILAFLIHYTAIIMAGFYLFYIIISKVKRSAMADLFIIVLLSTIGVAGTTVLNQFLNTTGYSGYLGSSNTILGFIQVYILIFICIVFYKKLMYTLRQNNTQIYYDALIYNVIVLTASIPIGAASRTNLYFDMIRIILWLEIYNTFLNIKMANKQSKDILISVVTFALVIIWIIFKIHQIWYGYGIMPYYNELFFI